MALIMPGEFAASVVTGRGVAAICGLDKERLYSMIEALRAVCQRGVNKASGETECECADCVLCAQVHQLFSDFCFETANSSSKLNNIFFRPGEKTIRTCPTYCTNRFNRDRGLT
jgi:hypothetical protein